MQFIASVSGSDELMPSVYLIWLESPHIGSTARPGQFIMVRCGDYLLPRPLSIHRLAEESRTVKLAFLLNVVGKCTYWLSRRQIGDKVELFGPLGNGYSIYPDSHHLLLVAGGIGIAPLHFLAREAVNQSRAVTLLLGAPTATYLYPTYLLPAEVQVITATEDGSAGKKGMVTDLLPDFVDWADQIFACGPTSMYPDMANKNQRLLKTKPIQLSLEVRMGCGFGVCYGCTVRTKNGLKQVCKDGPVFDFDEILWDELASI